MLRFKQLTTPQELAWFRYYDEMTLAEDWKGIVAYRDTRIRAGCILQNWSEASVEIHHVMFDPFIIRGGWLRILGEAVFGEHRLSVYGLIPEHNKASLKFHKHIGFRETGRVANGHALGIDYVLVTLRRDEWESRDDRTTQGRRYLAGGR